MNIYTKTGDQGSTGNLLGQRIMKSDLILSLQGDVDECNAHIGYLRSLLKQEQVGHDIDTSLKGIQKNLFKVGVSIAMGFSESKISESKISESDVKVLEVGIDNMLEVTGVLKHFIYYNGAKSGNYCQIIRAVVRRAERQFVAVLEKQDWKDAYPMEYQYMNRLSDYFYAMSRYINHLMGYGDEVMTLD